MQWLNFLKTNLKLKSQKAQLEEHCKSMNIIILDLKYAQKIFGKSSKIRLDWCWRHLDKHWHNIFFIDEITINVDNPSGYKWVKKNEKYIEYK